MKLNQLLTMCAVAAALCLSTDTLLAQAAGGGNGFGAGGNAGGNGFGGGGGRRGGGNFDPAARMQMQLENYRTQLNFTNDNEWAAIQPLVQKVLEAKTALGNANGRGGFGGGRRGGNNQGGPGGPGGQTTASLEQQALQKAIDDDAPAAQIKNALDRYVASQKTKQAALTAAQEALRQVLSAKQEAQATLLGLLPSTN
jgi:hypothetical protein